MRRAVLALWWVLLCCTAVRAQSGFVYTPDSLTIHVRHDTLVFHPVQAVVRVARDPYLSLSDPTVRDFLRRVDATVEASSDLASITAHRGAAVVTWDVNANRGQVRGTAEDDASATMVRNGEVVIALHALTDWLGLTLTPVDASRQEYLLVASLGAVQAGLVDGRRQLHLVGAMDCQFYPNNDGTVRVDLPNTVCRLSADRVDVGGASVQVQDHGSATTPTRLLVTPDAFWGLQCGPDSLALVPHYPGTGTDAHLTSLLQAGATWTLVGSDALAYSWHWSDQVLTLDLVHCVPDAFVDAGVAQLLCEKPFGVTRVTLKVPPGQGVQVMRIDKRQVQITQGPGLALTATSGFDNGGPLARGTIVIDPGHGGSDPGAISPLTGLMEKTVTLDVGLRLQTLLQGQGWKVVMTRSDDRDLTYAGSPDREELAARADLADAPGVDLFVSIHCNANLNPACRGTSIHWYKAEDLPLAMVLRDDLAQALGIPSNGTEQSPFYVVKHNKVPAVLIETAYITNGTDGALLGSPDFRQKLAEAIDGALNRYMQQYGAARTARP